MGVRNILLDTNAYSAFKRNAPEAIEIIRHAPLICIDSIVLGELLSGFAVGTREPLNRQELESFLASSRVRLVSVDERTAEHYAQVYKELKPKGRPITNDMWIAAGALQYGLAVFTYDAHFQVVDGLVAGNHLSDFVF